MIGIHIALTTLIFTYRNCPITNGTTANATSCYCKRNGARMNGLRLMLPAIAGVCPELVSARNKNALRCRRPFPPAGKLATKPGCPGCISTLTVVNTLYKDANLSYVMAHSSMGHASGTATSHCTRYQLASKHHCKSLSPLSCSHVWTVTFPAKLRTLANRAASLKPKTPARKFCALDQRIRPTILTTCRWSVSMSPNSK